MARLRPALVAAAVLAVFFAPALVTHGQFLFRDSGRMHHANKAWIAERWAAGEVPAWNPYAGLGVPVAAGGVDAPFHPFNALLVVLPFEAGFKAWILLSYLLAALGAFAWARRLGASEAAALVAGLGFALSGYLVSTSDNATYLTTMAAVPCLLAAGHAFLARGGPGRLALVGGASYLCASGGDPQAWGFALLALATQRLLLGPRDVPWRTAGPRTAAALAAALAAAAPVVLPMVAWLPHSGRSEEMNWVEYVHFDLFPGRILEFGVPHLVRPAELAPRSPLYRLLTGDTGTPVPWVLSEYLGATALTLALLAAARRREARALLAVAAAFTWMAMGHFAGFGQLARALPVLNGFRYWEKLAFWPALLVAIAAGLGVDALRAGVPPRFTRAVTAVASAALASAAAAAGATERIAAALAPAPDQLAVARQAAANLRDGLLHAGAFLAALAALAALAPRRPRLAAALPALAVALVTLDLGAANLRGYVLSPPELVAFPSPFAELLRSESPLPRIVTPFPTGELAVDGLAPHERAGLWSVRACYSGWNTAHRVGNFEAYAALFPVRAARYRRRAGLVKQLPGVGIWGVSHAVVPGRPERAAEMNLPPPYRVVAADPVLDAVLLGITHRPRAYLARELASVDRRGAMEFVLDDRSVATDRTVLEATVPAGYVPPAGDAEVVRDAPERVDVRARAAGPALLVLNDVYAEGWRAEVDDAPAEILPANYLARGVWIPPGEHVVSFRYRTPLLREGWLVLAAGALGLALWAARRRRADA
jgi:hypothetical protein